MIESGMISLHPSADFDSTAMNTRNAEDVQGWDANAARRAEELYSNDDPAYRSLTNIILNEVKTRVSDRQSHLLDVGCGLGVLTNSLIESGYCNTSGIDPSAVSIDLANARFSARRGGRGTFQVYSLEQFTSSQREQSFDALVANMTLHCTADMAAFFQSAASLLSKNGTLLITIPNPRTYLQTREDLEVKNLDFNVAQKLKVPFRIRGHVPHPEMVSFYHRPVRLYAQNIDAVGLRIDDIYYPSQVGPGRSQDIAVIVVVPSNFPGH